jgi:hypothetical protein
VTIWIDPPAWPAHGRLWSHLVSDVSYDELHAFASANGIPSRGFEGDHYDVPEERYAALVAAGATPVSGNQLARTLRDSGLRIPKRRHERVVRSTLDASWLPAGGRVDVIASRQEQPPANTVVIRLALLCDRAVLAVEHSDGMLDLPSRRVVDQTPAEAVQALSAELLGRPRPAGAELIGYVRNTVRSPNDTYPWPTPHACFAVYLARSARAEAADTGIWLDPDAAARDLAERHWWPLLAERLAGR